MYLPAGNTVGFSAGSVLGIQLTAAGAALIATGSTSTTQFQQTLGASPAGLDTGGIIDLRNMSITGGDPRVLGFGQIGGSAYIRANLSAAGTACPLDIYTNSALSTRFATSGNVLVGGTSDLGAGYLLQLKDARANANVLLDIRQVGTTGANTAAQLQFLTPSANTTAVFSLNDNNGSNQYFTHNFGSAVTNIYWNAPTYTFRSQNGSVTFATLQATGFNVTGTSGNNQVTVGSPAHPGVFSIQATDSGNAAAWFTDANTVSGFYGSAVNIPINFLTNNVVRGAIAASGAWTLSAPTSGNTLTVNGLAGASTALNIQGGNSASGNALLIGGNFTGAGTSTLISFQDANNTSGINVQLVGNGATTPNKTLRVINGNFEIVNSAYTTVIAQLTDGGVFKVTSDQGALTELGFRGVPQNIQNASYTTVLADAARHLYHSSASAHTWTIDSNANVAYPIGTTLTFVADNGSGNVTIAITTDTLRLSPGGTTGSRTLAANGRATALKITATSWQITGTNLT